MRHNGEIAVAAFRRLADNGAVGVQHHTFGQRVTVGKRVCHIVAVKRSCIAGNSALIDVLYTYVSGVKLGSFICAEIDNFGRSCTDVVEHHVYDKLSLGVGVSLCRSSDNKRFARSYLGRSTGNRTVACHSQPVGQFVYGPVRNVHFVLDICYRSGIRNADTSVGKGAPVKVQVSVNDAYRNLRRHGRTFFRRCGNIHFYLFNLVVLAYDCSVGGNRQSAVKCVCQFALRLFVKRVTYRCAVTCNGSRHGAGVIFADNTFANGVIVGNYAVLQFVARGLAVVRWLACNKHADNQHQHGNQPST